MGPGRDRTRDPWICSQTRICCQTRYRLRYAARYSSSSSSSSSSIRWDGGGAATTAAVAAVVVEVLVAAAVAAKQAQSYQINSNNLYYPNMPILTAWVLIFITFM